MGCRTGTVTVPARSVAVLVDREPVKTSVIAAPNKLLAKAGTSVKVTGKVIAVDGSAPAGTVTVTDNGKVIATATLAAAAKGKIDIALPALSRGTHLIRTSFAGGADYENSRALIPIPVLIY